MIRLDIQEYCDNCLDFSPAVDRPQKAFGLDGTVVQTDTIITCEHATRCEMIKRYLTRKMKGDSE